MQAKSIKVGRISKKYPLSSQLGFIHAIPEDDFDIASATITDVGFLGFFPKLIFLALRRCDTEIQRFSAVNITEFKSLVDNLIAAFFYRPIAIQKVIHILLAKHKSMLTNTAINDNEENLRSDNDNPGLSTMNTSATELTPGNLSSTINLKNTCYANICRLLRARGIIRHQITCRNGHNFCSGCESELANHRKVLLLENEMLALSVNNDILAPLLEYRSKPISIKHFRNTLSCLHTFMNKSRDNYIFGAARYLANTLGIVMPESLSSNLIDTPLTSTESKQIWRKATFFCRCQGNIPTVS